MTDFFRSLLVGTGLIVCGGFAAMNPDNTLNINVAEAALPEQIDKNVY